VKDQPSTIWPFQTFTWADYKAHAGQVVSNPRIETLGPLATDGNGRLLVLGGKGESGSVPGASAITSYANNDGWFDDVSDGPVTVYLALKGKPVAVVPAWVICPPPDFAPHLTNVRDPEAISEGALERYSGDAHHTHARVPPARRRDCREYRGDRPSRSR